MSSNIHYDILSKEQKNILPHIRDISKDFLLVGGTAVALYIGHRKSIDFDFFSNSKLDIDFLKDKLRKTIGFDKILVEKSNDLTFISQNVKLTYLYYPFSIKENLKLDYNINMTDLLTLLAMKIYALGRRSKWKDYVDIYFGLKYFTLNEIILKAKSIFGNELNEKIIRLQLAYFKDIDYTEEVIYISECEISDKKIQNYLTKISLS